MFSAMLWYRSDAQGNVTPLPTVLANTFVCGRHFEEAQSGRWLLSVSEPGDGTAAYSRDPYSGTGTVTLTDASTSVLDVYTVLKGAQVRHRRRLLVDKGPTTADVCVNVAANRPKTLNLIAHALLMLVAQYEKECAVDPGVPRITLQVSSGDCAKIQMLLSLQRPATDGEYVNMHQLGGFVDLVISQCNNSNP